jgi:hypothetical protein
MDAHQRKVYAARRASRAVDRQLVAGDIETRRRAGAWAIAWGVVAGYPVAAEQWQRRHDERSDRQPGGG